MESCAKFQELIESFSFDWVEVAVNDWLAEVSAIPHLVACHVYVIDAPDEVDARLVLGSKELLFINIFRDLRWVVLG